MIRTDARTVTHRSDAQRGANKNLSREKAQIEITFNGSFTASEKSRLKNRFAKCFISGDCSGTYSGGDFIKTADSFTCYYYITNYDHYTVLLTKDEKLSW